MTKRDYIYGIAFLIIVALFGFQKCSGDKELSNLSDNIARYNDDAIKYRQVNGRTVADSKGSELTKEQFQAVDKERYERMQEIIKGKDRIIGSQAKLIAALSSKIEFDAVDEPVQVTINERTKTKTIDISDSCLTGEVSVDSTGQAHKKIQIKPLQMDIAVSRIRERWFKEKKVTATGMIIGNCGNITAQKVVIITEKKKLHQKGLFKAGAGIVLFTGLRFLITGKL